MLDPYRPPGGDAHHVPAAFLAPKVDIDVGMLATADERTLQRVGELMRELRDLRRRDPLAFYEPAGWKHHCFHLDRSRLRALFGGNRAGKSHTGTMDTVLQLVPRELVPVHLQPYKHHDCDVGYGNRWDVRFVVPDMKRTGKVIRDKLKEMLPRALLKHGSFDRTWSKSEDLIVLECGCSIELLSTEMDLDKFGGSARHRIVYDEEPHESYRLECAMRLASTGGDELFQMTPLKGLTWTYQRIYKRRGEDGVGVYTVGMRDNRFLSAEDVDYVLGLITNEAERRQREFGEFSERGGMIYPNFADTSRPPFSLDEVAALDKGTSIDPGIRHAGFVFGGFGRDNELGVYAASLLKNSDVDGYVEHLDEVEKRWEVKRDDVTYVIDPAARIRNLVTGQNVVSALIERGVFPVLGQNEVEAGIMEVKRRIRDGSLKVSSQLQGLFDEAIEYALREPEEGKDEVYQVIKRNDHRLDALRYLAMHRPWLAPSTPHQLGVQGDPERAGPPPRPVVPGSVMGAMV